ncbi:UpxY family transcription antiterminator [Mucilaginibacter ginsenosidivorax]|uniref:UpxY family transcription antiterminator n=1 Tax=Mucilaginibacter ginsenosidivorax TaxID=862126 RepID=A0A5B8W4T7_9SPHI|nr:UpxY family transcription antiterminator [Mucilaginibacter ginsenosidivorax]QEC77936.1 UpxY family transcription antiterminator [Mucilaginibacter ginsenosidivorax]
MNLNASSTKNWYPVYTQPRAEKKAFQALTDKGVEAYLPLHRQLKQWSDRKKWVEEPFIKSYIFVNIAQHEQADILMTKGISRFLYFMGKPASMPTRQITELKLLMASPYELEITEENLQTGEKIMIKAGPLKGMTGEIVSQRSQKQLILRLESIGCSIIVHVAASYIERF